MKRTIVLVSVLAAAGVLAAGSSANPRSGALHVTKECSQYDATAGSFCTITGSNIPAIKAAMRVVYLSAAGAGDTLDSDIVLSTGHGNAAYGHVVLDATTSHVSLSGGTGRFATFEAEAEVSVDAKGIWHWDGTYSFTAPDDD